LISHVILATHVAGIPQEQHLLKRAATKHNKGETKNAFDKMKNRFLIYFD
jgi:hypothetical protein